MKLSILERILLLNILPKQGDILTLKIIRELRHKIEFTKDELVEFKLQVTGEQIQWDSHVTSDIDIDFHKSEEEIIATEIKALNQKKELTESHITLYDKFIG